MAQFANLIAPVIFTANPKPDAMINLKKLFHPNPCLLSVSKADKELLESFLACKTEYDAWNQHRQPQKIRFRFYFPTAIDFYYDGSKLFTVFFKKDLHDTPVFHELKMSKANYSSIRSANWKPFEDLMTEFLSELEEKNKTIYVQRTKSLREYVSICQETSPAA